MWLDCQCAVAVSEHGIRAKIRLADYLGVLGQLYDLVLVPCQDRTVERIVIGPGKLLVNRAGRPAP